MNGSLLTRPLAAELSVREARDIYLCENGFSADAYDEPYVEVKIWWVSMRIPNTKRRSWAVRLHDLHHVATGFGTDPDGEAMVSVWELRRNLRPLGLYVGCLVLGFALLGMLLSPRRSWWVWKQPTTGAGLYNEIGLSYDELLSTSLGELRGRLGLPVAGLENRPRRLNAAAPSLASRV